MKEKICKNCGCLFNNKRKNGGYLGSKQWNTIQNCSSACAAKNKVKNKYKKNGNVTYIYDNKGRMLKIDTEDISKVNDVYWLVSTKGYGVTYSKGVILLHHRIIGKPTNGLVVDHKNGKKFDNRKSNLRIVKEFINSINSKKPIRSNTGILGIYYTERWNKGKYLYKKYKAEIQSNNVIKSKLFNTLEDAIKWRKDKEKEMFIKTGFKLVK